MKKIKKIPCLLIGVSILFLCIVSNTYALTAGETYTVSLQQIQTDGTVASAATTSSPSTAGSDGKISFSFSSVPNNTTCNFLLITVKDSSDTAVRRSITPCPNAGESLPIGVSGLTASQTDALLAALAAAGTDDPILAVFGLAIVRSTGVDAKDLTFMATLCNQGINNSGGFIDYLTSNGVTTAQVATYRKKIVGRLANISSGYSKLIKDSVDAATDSEKLDARGEAASKLLLVLVQAATDTGFSQDRVLEAFNAMGAVIMPVMTAATSSDISDSAKQMINSSIGGGIQKLKADRDIEKYSAALTTLGASGADVTSYQTAATTLLNAMTTAFKTFEQVFDGNETDTEIATADSAFGTAMQAAFDQFITDTAASNARITTMIANIDTALGAPTGLTVSEFQFYKSDGNTVNWPITMVIIVDWVSTVVTNSGSVSYTRDNTSIPNTMTWLNRCSDETYDNATDCTNNGETWSIDRSSFSLINSNYASIFGIQQDIEILEFVRWAAQVAAGNDMGDHQTLEKNFATAVAGLASNIGGTTDGSIAISSTEKSAVVTLLKSPQF